MSRRAGSLSQSRKPVTSKILKMTPPRNKVWWNKTLLKKRANNPLLPTRFHPCWNLTSNPQTPSLPWSPRRMPPRPIACCINSLRTCLKSSRSVLTRHLTTPAHLRTNFLISRLKRSKISLKSNSFKRCRWGLSSRSMNSSKTCPSLSRRLRKR